MEKKEKTFWITNISSFNVSLADLNLTIKPNSSVNLLDKKHYYFTIEQLEKSAKYGSIFKKSDKIIIRKIAPNSKKKEIELSKEILYKAEKSLYKIQEQKFEELNISDEEFANENTEV